MNKKIEYAVNVAKKSEMKDIKRSGWKLRKHYKRICFDDPEIVAECDIAICQSLLWKEVSLHGIDAVADRSGMSTESIDDLLRGEDLSIGDFSMVMAICGCRISFVVRKAMICDSNDRVVG